jgi:hypothetical protein
MSAQQQQGIQLSFAEDLEPVNQTTAGATRGKTRGEVERKQTIWAHEAADPSTASTTYTPVFRRDPEWVAKTLHAHQLGVINLTASDVDEFGRLLDEQFVYEAVNTSDHEAAIAVTLQEKRRRGIAMAKMSRAEVEDLHIPLCAAIKSTITNPRSSRWLIAELTSALKGELRPAMDQAQTLRALLAARPLGQ